MVAVVVACGATTVTASPAPAATYELPLTVYGDIALDEANAQLFVSGGAGVAVRHLDGAPKATLSGLDDAGGLLIDGSTLYVAQCGTNSIAAFDTVTLQARPSIGLGSLSPQGSQGNPARPCGIVKAGGRLWFSTSDTWGQIGSVSLTTGTVQAHLASTYYGPILASDPSNPNRIAITDGSSSPPDIGIYDVDPLTGSLALVGAKQRISDSAIPRDLRFTPDGASLMVSAGAPYLLRKLDAATKTVETSYSIGAYPVAGLMSADAAWVVAGRDAPYDPDVHVYPASGGAAYNRYELGSGRILAKGAIELAADNSRGYAVSFSYSAPAPLLHVYDAPTVPTTSLSITAPASGSSAASLAITGALTFSGDGAVGGHDVVVTATPPSGPVVTIGTATTDSSGAWSLMAPAGTMATGGTWTLRATVAAFAPFPGRSSEHAVSMAGTAPIPDPDPDPEPDPTPDPGPTTTSKETALSLTTPIAVTHGAAATFSGVLSYSPSASPSGRSISLRATPPGSGPQEVATALTGMGGGWSVTVPEGTFVPSGTWLISAVVDPQAGYPGSTTTHALVVVSNSTSTSTSTTSPIVYPVMPPPTVSPDQPREPVPPAPVRTPTVVVEEPVADPATPVAFRSTARADRFLGTAAVDRVRGLGGNDQLRGGAGDDWLWGDAGNDVLRGEAGHDRIFGGAGRDVLDGGPGNDVIDANDRARGDRVRCGAGRDIAYVNAGDSVHADCERVIRR